MIFPDSALPADLAFSAPFICLAFIVNLQNQLREENERAAAELPLSEPFDPNAPWSWQRYSELLQLAERAWGITRQ